MEQQTNKGLGLLREKLDAIDNELADLLCRRLAVTEEVAVLKAKEGLSAADPSREEAIFSRLCKGRTKAEEEELRETYKLIFTRSKERINKKKQGGSTNEVSDQR